MGKLPAFYSVTFCGDDVLPFDDLFWSLDDAKNVARADMEAAWGDDVTYDPNKWVAQEWDNSWYYYEGDVSYTIKKTQPARRP